MENNEIKPVNVKKGWWGNKTSRQKVFSSTNVYKDSLVLEKGNYQINFVATNNFDYNQKLSEYDYSFII